MLVKIFRVSHVISILCTKFLYFEKSNKKNQIEYEKEKKIKKQLTHNTHKTKNEMKIHLQIAYSSFPIVVEIQRDKYD